jgi:hypothetical protein
MAGGEQLQFPEIVDGLPTPSSSFEVRALTAQLQMREANRFNELAERIKSDIRASNAVATATPTETSPVFPALEL